MSSYQRLIVHRVAQHFRLHHVVVDTDGQGQKRAIVLFKTPESRVYVVSSRCPSLPGEIL